VNHLQLCQLLTELPAIFFNTGYMIMPKSKLVQWAQAVQPAFGNACYIVKVQLSVG